MFTFISKLLWWRKSEPEEEQEGFEQGFYDIPHPKEREKMSPEKLAIVLSHCEKDSPQYILVGHELNLRIAQVQSRAAYGAAVFGLVGVALGAWLQSTFQKPSEPPKCVCECQHGGPIQQSMNNPIPRAIHSPSIIESSVPESKSVQNANHTGAKSKP